MTSPKYEDYQLLEIIGVRYCRKSVGLGSSYHIVAPFKPFENPQSEILFVFGLPRVGLPRVNLPHFKIAYYKDQFYVYGKDEEMTVSGNDEYNYYRYADRLYDHDLPDSIRSLFISKIEEFLTKAL